MLLKILIRKYQNPQKAVLPTGFIQNQKKLIWFSEMANGFEFLGLIFWFISGFLT
jgi:hypothetical protein